MLKVGKRLPQHQVTSPDPKLKETPFLLKVEGPTGDMGTNFPFKKI